MVAFLASKIDEKGSRQSHAMEAQVGVAQSWKRLGQNSHGMGR